jgi:capsular exopolysaccharide synthesis family protein
MTAVVVAGSAFAFSTAQTKQYTAAAKLLFRDPGLDQQASGVVASKVGDPERDTATNLRLVKLGDVASRTAQALGQGLTASSVLDAVAVSPEGQTDIATVTAKASDRRLAAQIANTFTEQFIASRRRIDQARVAAARALVERQLAELSPVQRNGPSGQSLEDRSESLRILGSLQTGNAELVERATPPASASSPQVMRNTIIAAFLGLLLGIGLAFLAHRLDRRVREPEDLESAFRFPLLGVVPESAAYTSGSNGNAPLALPPRESEAFRMLRAHLRYFNVDRDVRTVLVTSAAPGEGKSTVAYNLAHAAATLGTSTLLIEADLRRPSLGARLGESSRRGLGEVLIGACHAGEAIKSITIASGVNGSSREATLDVLLANAVPPNPTELLESQAMHELLTWSAAHYELVIVDTPPLTVVSDAIPLLRRVDGVLIVSRFGSSTRGSAQDLRDRLLSLGAPVLGVVGNAYSQNKRGAYGYGYGYGPGYDDEPNAGQTAPAPAAPHDSVS